jgi:hypothetical protein
MNLKKNIAISETGFLFNPTSGDSYSLNPIGKEIVTLLQENKTYEEVKTKILSGYATDNDTFEKDYYDFISMLKNYKLIENA